MNWDVFDIGDDISKVVLELEKNLQLLNNDAIAIGFAALYFEGIREDINAKAKQINESRAVTQKMREDYDLCKDEKQKALIAGQHNELNAKVQKLDR